MSTTVLCCQSLLLLLCSGLISGAALHPINCAPCTEERLSLCPPVPTSCPETAREPGCGCCHTCALQLGEPCGVYTARCGRGLICRPHTGESRSLSALIRGHGACLPISDMAETAVSLEPDSVLSEDTGTMPDQQFNIHLMLPTEEDMAVPWNLIHNYESMKAKTLSELKKWKEQGPCKKELYRALEKIAKAQQRTGGEIYKFYLPNCNRNGLYHSKQCETSLSGSPARCWCVYPRSGVRVPGSSEVIGDPECEQHLDSRK